MEIKDGTTRQVIIIGSFAFKIPRDLIPLVTHYTRWFFSNRKDAIINTHWKIYYARVIKGLNSNKVEWERYKKDPFGFLAPSYIKLTNFLLVSKNIKGESISFNEIQRRMNLILDLEEMKEISGDHTFFSQDWKRTKKGIILVDYGDPERSVFGRIFTKYREKLGEALR